MWKTNIKTYWENKLVLEAKNTQVHKGIWDVLIWLAICGIICEQTFYEYDYMTYKLRPTNYAGRHFQGIKASMIPHWFSGKMVKETGRKAS